MASNDCVNCFNKCKNPNAPEYQKCYKPENNNGCNCDCGGSKEPTTLLGSSNEFADFTLLETEKTIVKQKFKRSNFV